MRKAQSALEYLMTYGWAILIIVIVGAALFALGVFNPGGSTALQVRGLSNFQVDDALFDTNGTLTLVLGVKTGKTTTVLDVDFSILGGIECNNTADIDNVVVPASQTKDIIIYPEVGCGLTAGDLVQLDTDITYTVAGSQIVHTDTGTLTITVQ
ncbi:MAG: hypothetical protein JW791_03070 [Nanoarchaeota archaeon]|nr:hypothetical protein [Nanoarchaeota archaeon]